jgi:hypothetical protein
LQAKRRFLKPHMVSRGRPAFPRCADGASGDKAELTQDVVGAAAELTTGRGLGEVRANQRLPLALAASCRGFDVHPASTTRRETRSRGLETVARCGFAGLWVGVHPASTARSSARIEERDGVLAVDGEAVASLFPPLLAVPVLLAVPAGAAVLVVPPLLLVPPQPALIRASMATMARAATGRSVLLMASPSCADCV